MVNFAYPLLETYIHPLQPNLFSMIKHCPTAARYGMTPKTQQLQNPTGRILVAAFMKVAARWK